TTIARPTFHIPYTRAGLEVTRTAGGYDFRCERRRHGRIVARFRGCYRPISCPFRSQSRSLEEWLTERYCYYSVSHGRTYRCELAHRPWPLQHAEATIEKNSLASTLGIDLPDEVPHLLYAHGMEAIFWWPQQVARYTPGDES